MATERIFHLMLGTDGGTERFFLRLARAFHERGISQQFAIRPNMNWRGELAQLGPIHEGFHLRRWPLSAARAALMKTRLKTWRPDAVMAWRAPAARLVPKDLTGARIVRLGDYPSHLRHFGNLDCIVGIAPEVLAHCRDLGWRGRTELISNFPPAGTSEPLDRSRLSTPGHAKLVCAIGRFAPTKGFDTLLRAVARTEDLWLWLVGDGESRTELETLAAELGISDRVRMPGWVSDPSGYISAADIFCVPSHQEALGNVLLEGWKSGRPMVATRAEGPLWAATDREDALLVDIDDVAGLAAALSKVAGSPDLARRLVAGGYRTLSDRFSQAAVVDAYLGLFDDIRSARAVNA